MNGMDKLPPGGMGKTPGAGGPSENQPSKIGKLDGHQVVNLKARAANASGVAGLNTSLKDATNQTSKKVNYYATDGNIQAVRRSSPKTFQSTSRVKQIHTKESQANAMGELAKKTARLATGAND